MIKIEPFGYNMAKRIAKKIASFDSSAQSKLEDDDLSTTQIKLPPFYPLNCAPIIIKSPQSKFIELCKYSTFQNYNSSNENIKSGTFRMDLHSHSNHSDGWGDVKQLLDEVAEYSDKLYAKTNRKFTFALTDHDDVTGVIEAQQYISENKEKFKHVNFVPGVELSFVFNSDGEVKSGELLAYFINPNSDEIKQLIGNVRTNRSKMIKNFINRLGDGFCVDEFRNYFINCNDETYAYNLHYRLRNYAQIKNRINSMAQEYGIDSRAMYRYLMRDYIFDDTGQRKVSKSNVTPESFDRYLQESLFETNTSIIDKDIDKICHEFYPKIINGKVVSGTENSLELIMETFKGNDSVLFGFAHPYFTAKEMQDFKKGFDELLKISKGRIVFSENYHQAYPEELTQSKQTKQYISEVNSHLASKGLVPIGGRDNHSQHFLTKINN